MRLFTESAVHCWFGFLSSEPKIQNRKEKTAMTNNPVSTQTNSVSDQKVMNKIHQILDKGNNAEVKKAKDGGLRVYEVKKTIC